jgi:hypothetical protein
MEDIQFQFEKVKNNCVNPKIILTKNIFLRSLGVIYLFAYLSLYVQIQGLWGDEGILPAKTLLEKLKENFKEKANFWNFPTLTWFSPIFSNTFNFFVEKIYSNFNFNTSSDVENTLYLLAIIGIIFSVGIVCGIKYFYNPFGFFIVWLIYLNFFIIGQVFMSFQWDIFLLETGFIAIFFSTFFWGDINELAIIKPIDDVCYYVLRFLMFRFMYSNGIVKLTANCPSWLSFNALHFHFQSQPIPNSLSHFAHFLPDGVKKILVALTYLIEIYVPFLFFTIIIRRLRIFAGQLQICLQIGIILTGNYNFFNFLTLVVNLSTFDDEYLRTWIPQFVLDLFALDPLSNLKNKLDKVEDSIHIQENKEENEELENKKTDTPSTPLNKFLDEEPDNSIENSPDEKIKKILGNKKLRKIYDIEENGNITIQSLFSKSHFITEIFIFLNFLSVTFLFTFFYLYPLKDLLPGQLKINPEKDLKNILNKTYLNFYMVFIFCYILFVFGRDVVFVMKISLIEKFSLDALSEKGGSSISVLNRIYNVLYSVLTFIMYSVFSLLFMLYFLNTVNVFYNSVDLQLVNKNNKSPGIVEKYLEQGVNLSEYIFTRFRDNHGYGLFRVMTGVGGRPELEIKILNSGKDKWENLNFIYKISDDDKFKLKFIMPHQPRVDWQIWFSALSKDINSEGWLVVMLGKILERNPVILDLLGYKISEKEHFYKCKLFI